MKTLVLLALVGLTTSGCLTSKLDKTVAAMAKDPAGLHLRLSSVYGVLELTRANPLASTPPYSLTADGNVNVAESTRPVAAPAPVVVAAAPVPAPAVPSPAPQKAVKQAPKAAAAPKATPATNSATKQKVRPIPKAKQAPAPAK